LQSETDDDAKTLGTGGTRADLEALREQVRLLSRQVELEREKTFALSELLIRSAGTGIVPAGSPEALIAPIEYVDGDDKSPIFVFGGMAMGVSMPVAEFRRFLSGQDRKIFFIKDFSQSWYQFGLVGLSRGVEETATLLRTLVPRRAKEVSVIGTSAGGFAAILFGSLLGARRIVAFAPQTVLSPPVVRRFKSHDTRVKRVLEEGSHRDLLPVVAAHPGPEITIHVGADNRVDLAAAKHLAKARGVRVERHPCATHAIAAWMRDNGRLEEALKPVLG
jgi:hypothetical protein